MKSCLSTLSLLLGSLSKDDGDGNENVTWKYNFAFFLLFRDYSGSVNLYIVAELSWNRIGRNGVKVKTENE